MRFLQSITTKSNNFSAYYSKFINQWKRKTYICIFQWQYQFCLSKYAKFIFLLQSLLQSQKLHAFLSISLIYYKHWFDLFILYKMQKHCWNIVLRIFILMLTLCTRWKKQDFWWYPYYMFLQTNTHTHIHTHTHTHTHKYTEIHT